MIIYIGNLPAVATKKDLCKLGRLPESTPPRICKKQDGNGGLYRFGLVHARSDREGRKLIKRLQGASCYGNTLEAREYEYRSAVNERRRMDWREVLWNGAERRQGDRRSLG